jgi:hypothetical protein
MSKLSTLKKAYSQMFGVINRNGKIIVPRSRYNPDVAEALLSAIREEKQKEEAPLQINFVEENSLASLIPETFESAWQVVEIEGVRTCDEDTPSKFISRRSNTTLGAIRGLLNTKIF